jgi:hypothetical protein
VIAATILLALAAPDWTRAADAVELKDGKPSAALFEDAIRVNIPKAHRVHLAPIVAAIRYAENGRAGREYGCLSKYAKDKGYRKQAGECAFTVWRTYERWIKAGKPGGFIQYLGNRYCPIGAGNDPGGLNKHWVRNVTHYYRKFR